jgi:hypothetical protein
MIITNEKIEVTLEMMENNNMINDELIGIPSDPHNPGMGLAWKEMHEISDSDFDKIEEYFLLKLRQAPVINQVCTCTKARQTPVINGKNICSICNKPTVQTCL